MSVYKLHSNIQKMSSGKLTRFIMPVLFLTIFGNQCNSQTYVNTAGIKDIYEIGMIHVGSSPINSIGELSDQGTLLATTIDGSSYIVNLQDGTARNSPISSGAENQGYSYIINTPVDQPLLMVKPGADVTVVRRGLNYGVVTESSSFSLSYSVIFSQRWLMVRDGESKIARFDGKSGEFTQVYSEVERGVSAGDYAARKNYFAFAYLNGSDVIVYDLSSQKVIKDIKESENLQRSPVSGVGDLIVRKLPWLSTYLSNRILFISFCFYDNYIIIGSLGGKIRAYSTLTWQKVFEAEAQLSSPFPVGLSDDLPLVSFIDQDGKICLANLATGEDFHMKVSEFSQSASQSEITTLLLSHDGKYIVAGGIDGNIYAYQLKYQPPRILLYEDGSIHMGNEAHVKILGERFELKGIVQSCLPLKSITIGSTPVSFSLEAGSDSMFRPFLSGSSYPLAYSFSETLSVYKTQYFLSPPMVDRPMESVLHAVDVDDNLSTLSVKFERYSTPPLILITDPPLNPENGGITVRADSGAFEISGFVFSNYPIAFVNINGKKAKFEAVPQANGKVNVNNESCYKFSDMVLVQGDTSGSITVAAVDNQGDSSRISLHYVFGNAKSVLPPEIKITRVSINQNKNSDQFFEIEGLVNSYNPISQLTINGEKRIPLSTVQAYFPFSYSASFIASLPVTEIKVDTTTYGSGSVRLSVSDANGQSDSKEIYISEIPPYTIHREGFQPISIPGFLTLSAGTSTFALKSLDYPTPTLDAKKVSDLFGRFYNTSTANNVLLTGDDLTTEKLELGLKTLSRNALNNDFVVFFFSGYAVTSHNKTYLLTKNSQVQDLNKTALSTDELVASLKTSPQARGFLLLFDISPNTLSLTKFFGKEYPVHYTGSVESILNIAQQLPNSIVVLGVSKDEKGDFGKSFGQHGLFSYALLNALSGEADINGNGLIELGELIETLKDEVNLLSKGLQHVSVSGFSERDNMVPIFSMRKEVPTRGIGGTR